METILRPGGRHTAALLRSGTGGDARVTKDYRAASRTFRWTVGRILARRERRAYRRLAGVSGVPTLLATRPPDGIVLSAIEAVPVREAPPGLVTPALFVALDELLARLRERGVLHGDVKRNVLVDPSGRPWLVDLGASFVIPAWWGPVGRWLARTGGRYDRRSVVKLKAGLDPARLTAEERTLLRAPVPFGRTVDAVEGLFHSITRILGRQLDRGHGGRP